SRPMPPAGVPYALYLDFTAALTLREWPARVPMSAVERTLWLRMERWTYRNAAVIFCRGRHVRDSLIADYGVPESKIHVIGAGSSVPLPDSSKLAPCREPNVLFVGSDFLRKGGDVVLDAWPKVLEQVPEANLTMIGPVPVPLPPRVEA